MRVAVTGSAGFLGREVVRTLAARGHDVTAVTRVSADISGASRCLPVGNLLSADLVQICSDQDAIVNCAARVHITGREDPVAAREAYDAMNVRFPVSLAVAAREEGVSRFVQISSVAAIKSLTDEGEVADDQTAPAPQTPYGQSKLAADIALTELSSQVMPIISLRPPTIYGIGVGAFFARLHKAARIGLPLPIGWINNRRSIAYLENVGEAIGSAVSSQLPGTYLITDSEPVSTACIYRKLLSLHKYGERVFGIPRNLAWLGARVALGDRANSLLGNSAFSGARFASDLGWRPSYTIDAALIRTVAGENG